MERLRVVYDPEQNVWDVIDTFCSSMVISSHQTENEANRAALDPVLLMQFPEFSALSTGFETR